MIPMVQKNVRVGRDVWAAAQARADREGVTLSVAIRAFLVRYGKG